jgi:4-hydroxy-2-oxoheptanedioate aldolase
MNPVTANKVEPTGFGGPSSGVWCDDASPGMVARLALLGFDWVCLDAQHGGYSRDEIIEAARGFPPGDTQMVVRVPSCDFAAIGAEAHRAVAATFYPPIGERSWGQLGRIWGRAPLTVEEANSSTKCAVMIESAAALASVEDIAAVDGVDQLFVGPYDLSLSLGTTVPDLLDDDSDASPLSRIVQAATAYGRTVGGFAGTPELAERFRARGISCVAVASDLWITAEGARAALS